MTIKHLDPKVKERIANILELNYDVVVGDADGVDTSIQQLLMEYGASNATVYCAGEKPRNNVANWSVHSVMTFHPPGTRAFFTAKDIEMAKDADYGLFIWDAKSAGTLNNVLELLSRGKNALVFINKTKAFKKIVGIAELEDLVSCMSESAKSKADSKIKLQERIAGMRSRQRQLEILQESA